MEGVLSHIRKNKALVAVYTANLLVATHFFLVIYINSPNLRRFFTDAQVGILFTFGSLISTLLFLTAPKMLRAWGVFRYFILFLITECIAILGLSFYDAKIGTVLFFILHQASIPMLSFSLDVFFETVSKNEKETGELRGIYITLASAVLVIAPSIVGFILEKTNFASVYLLAALFLAPLALIARSKLQNIKTPLPEDTRFSKSFSKLWKIKDLRYGVLAHFILQFFYAWMVIYLPLYLTENIGFSWGQLGVLFTVMLLPFLLFEIPVGYLADKKIGEKELMIFGFSVMAISTALLLVPQTPSFFVWAPLLFLTRVGASISEITTESYFFKHTRGEHGDAISIFRITRPASYLIAPLTVVISLSFLSLGQAFWVLSIILIAGAIFALQITDTR